MEVPQFPALGNQRRPPANTVPPVTPEGQPGRVRGGNPASGSKRRNDNDDKVDYRRSTVVNVTSNLAILHSLEHDEVTRWVDKVRIHLANDGVIVNWESMISQHVYQQLPLIFAKP